jgi:hypothetical protein
LRQRGAQWNLDEPSGYEVDGGHALHSDIILARATTDEVRDVRGDPRAIALRISTAIGRVGFA